PADQSSWWSAHHPQRRSNCESHSRRAWTLARRPPPYSAPRLRNAHARRRRGPACDPGASGARASVHNPTLHATNVSPHHARLRRDASESKVDLLADVDPAALGRASAYNKQVLLHIGEATRQ